MSSWLRTPSRIFLLLVLPALYAATCWFGAGWLLMPPRESPSDWQAEMMRDPGAFGLTITRFVSADGTPCLFCMPNPGAGVGRRGSILRGQMGRAVAPFGDVRATIVLLHGWKMRKEGLLAVVERFCAAGFRCIVPDLPGHGENPLPVAGFGARTAERHLAAAVLDDAAARFHFTPRPALLWGLSMGGACALQAAAADPSRWDGVLIVSSFDRLAPVVRENLEASVPGLGEILGPGLALAIRLRGGFWFGDAEPVNYANALRVPAFVVHGEADDVIPMAAGRRLFEAIPTARQWLRVDGAHHSNVLGTPQQVFSRMALWSLARSRSQPRAKITASATH